MTKTQQVFSNRLGLRVVFWILAIILTIACFTYQDHTGPTYPLEGKFQTSLGVVDFQFLRSETIGTDLKIMLLDPVPDGISGTVKYRRFKSHDEWNSVPLFHGAFEFSRRGKKQLIQGLGASLPSLQERAGKYEFFVFISDGQGEPKSVTGEKPIYARYKASVPHWALLTHILSIFASMMLAIRTVFEAMVNGRYKWMIWATLISFILGGFVFGPIVQWYAFGVWWSGMPFGIDWTDNKVLLELAFWLLALYLNRGDRRHRGSVYLAGVITLLVYFIPHSIFGSEYDYTSGTGRGTKG